MNERGSDLKLLIVDHEPLGRASLIQLCDLNRHVEVVGEADSGLAALNAVQELRPDVMLLDIELPDMSGFDVLRATQASRGPLGIMVTAKSVHAAAAFTAGALDYLVKPVSADRFANAIERARARCDDRAGATKNTAQTAAEPKRMRYLAAALELRTKIVVGERQHRLYPLDSQTIDYIESDGNYVTIRASNGEYISRDSIKRLAADLADVGFVRIDRSLLVNIRAIAYAEALGHATFAFTLTSGVCLRSSATYRGTILEVLPLRRCRAGNRAIDA
jgi:DNA-binding LytR/AlgR family response regulator